ncbi:hypothetical protein LZC95_50295 [Pendulispora brunnea]|uniref:Uncharacterized protein n=1 Tax=Pendulispora brunnea TaxID=2905690 RepID=A0ABZ2KB40_9BACT
MFDKEKTSSAGDVHNEAFVATVGQSSPTSIRVELTPSSAGVEDLFRCVCAASDDLLKIVGALNGIWGLFADEHRGTIDLELRPELNAEARDFVVDFVKSRLTALRVTETMAQVGKEPEPSEVLEVSSGPTGGQIHNWCYRALVRFTPGNGTFTLRVMPVSPEGACGHGSRLRSFVYDLAADMERETEVRRAGWRISVDGPNAQILVDASPCPDQVEAAKQFVIAVVSEHHLS